TERRVAGERLDASLQSPLAAGRRQGGMNNGTRVRVYVADDHPVYRDGVVLALRRRPDFEVVGEADDGRTALEEIRVLKPDVALLDVKMPGLDGHAVLRAIQRDDLPVAVVLLSATVLPPEARWALA